MTIQIINYRPLQKGFLVGSFDLFIEKSGMEIFNCAHFIKGDREWISLPNREYIDKEGLKKYVSLVRFREKSHADEFVKRCLLAIKEHVKTMKVPEKQMNFVEQEFEEEDVPF